MKKILVFVFCFLFFTQVVAADDGRFSVDVSVDVTDSNASAARERAMAEANRAAFNEVVKKITDAESAKKLSEMPASHLLNFVKEVAVLEEKSSAVRYIATFRVKIHEDLLKTYMQEQNMPFLLQTTNRILVVPVYGENGAILNMDNPWAQAWNLKRAEGSVTFEPFDNNANLITMEEAVSLNGEALKKLYDAKGVDDVYVVWAEKTTNGVVIKQHSYLYGNNAFENVDVLVDTPNVWNESVESVAKKISSNVHQHEVLQNQEEHQIILLYDYDNLNDLVNTEKRLKDVAYVKDLQMDAVGGNRVQYKLVYIGAIEKLLTALKSKRFVLQDYEGFFVLQKI